MANYYCIYCRRIFNNDAQKQELGCELNGILYAVCSECETAIEALKKKGDLEAWDTAADPKGI